MTNSSGAIVGEDRFYPFGETRFTTGTMYTDKLFTGQREITGLGIYHYGARFYSPKLGRFLSADTIVPGYANPQTLNRYSYVINNPLRYTDPTGHRVCEDYQGSCLSEKQITKKYEEKQEKIRKKSKEKNKTDDGIGPITDAILSLPGSEGFWNNVATALDVGAWVTDAFAAGAVAYGGIYGAGLTLPGVALGGPAVPTVGGLAGMVIAEFWVQPILTFGNGLATLSTVSTVFADTKAGNTRIEDGVFSSTVRNSGTLTLAGWINKEAFLSLAIQSVAVTNDFGWTSLPFK